MVFSEFISINSFYNGADIMSFINESGVIASVLIAGANNVTGDIVSLLLLVYLILVVICFMFGIPLEFTAIIILPLTIAMASYYSNFLSLLIVLGIYITSLIAKNWLIK